MEPLTDVPLYEQIATRLRHRIARGELREGDRLPSLRSGAADWGVNLHTVRRAYAALEEEKLVETRDRSGTTVTACRTNAALGVREADLSSFVEEFVRTASERFGLEPTELADRVIALGAEDDPIWILECSDSLASSLAEQIRTWNPKLDVRPWLVSAAEKTPPGRILGTYYHYAEIRRACGGRSRKPGFFHVVLDERNLREVRDRARGRIILAAVASASGSALAAELKQALGPDVEVELEVTRQPVRVLRTSPADVAVILSPENWDVLAPECRSNPRVFPLPVQPDKDDLELLLGPPA